MKKAVILIFIVFSQNIFGQSAWDKVEMDFDKPLKNIFFLNENIGWGFSSVYNPSTSKNDNMIHRTTNGGLNWTSISLPEISYFKFHFVNQDTGWGIYGSKIYKTSNSGNNWDVKYSGNKSFCKIFCLTAQTCWVLGYEKLLFKTTDGGESWEELNINVNSHDIVDIFFINESIGFCCYQGIFKTIDGGETWTKKPTSHDYSDFHCIYFLTDSIGWAAGGTIYKTEDGGETWKFQKTASQNEESCYFINENKGWIFNLSDPHYITFNGGKTWSDYNTNIAPYGLVNFNFVNENIGYALNWDGDLYKTITGGVVTSINSSNRNFTTPKFELMQNYPNPFNPLTKIKFSTPKSELVQIKVYDVLGEQVKILINDYRIAGSYEVKFDASNLPSGVYFYEMISGKYVETKKMILLR
jgi:photosystem II stability/assembly factor-like uncharacterized protein